MTFSLAAMLHRTESHHPKIGTHQGNRSAQSAPPRAATCLPQGTIGMCASQGRCKVHQHATARSPRGTTRAGANPMPRPSVEESGMQPSPSAASWREFRDRYGNEIADITETHSRRCGERAHQPASREAKSKLQAIVAIPDAACLQWLDPLTRALLMDPAWRRFRVRALDELTHAQLAECAQYALDHSPARGSSAERAEVLMTLTLLDAARGWHAARRIKLVRAALTLVFRADYERATAIIRKAHGELRDSAGRSAPIAGTSPSRQP